MSEWWSYGLSDFLMFSPEAYWRLVARYNAQWWPGQLAAVPGLVAIFALLPRSPRTVLLLLAAAWLWVAAAFHWQRYAEIFLAAPWLAAASALQAGLLLAAMPALRASPAGRTGTALGRLLLAIALLFPLLAPVQGQPWSEAEVFGFTPDPTALATLGAVLALPGWHAWQRAALGVLPLLSLLLGSATRWLLA